MSVADIITILCGVVGAFFFLGGTLGLLRFPDLFSRLHALTKADNLGLGLIVLGLLFQADSVAAGAKLVLIWGLALWAASTSCYVIGRYALAHLEKGKAGEGDGDA
ncbi:MAG: monovalent cation/H(+) antiporter subunit G [Puniceicoccaceae bacterium]|nr:MAG: monovalent cation/H(+) antiporter subunit G [Puniceicoccaceae bacterium]